MELKVLKLYINRTVVYAAGSVINVTPAEAAFLQRDAPGCFEVVPESTGEKSVEAPPEDKMVKGAHKEK